MVEFVTAVIVSLVIAAASIALSELLRPKPDLENARPADLGDFGFPTATEGRVKPVFWGTVKIAGPNVVWYGDLRPKPIKNTIRTGLWSSETIITGFRYRVGFVFGLGLGGVTGFDGIRRIWIGDDEVYVGPLVSDGTIAIDEPNLFGGNSKGQGGVVGTLRVKPGTLTQTKVDYLDAFLDPNIPRRGLINATWEGGEVGTSTSIKPWAFEASRFPNELGITGDSQAGIALVQDQGTGYAVDDILTLVGGTFSEAATFRVTEVDSAGNVVRVIREDLGSYSATPANPVSTTGGTGAGCTLNVEFHGPHVVNGLDANPVEVIFEYLTNTDWGRGYPPADVDTANFLAAAATLWSEGNGFSFMLDTPRLGTQFLEELERQIDGKVHFDMRTGKWIILLARGGYDPELLPQATDVGSEPSLLEVKKFDDGLWQNTANQIRVPFIDRARDYFRTSATADDLANLRIQGQIVTEEVRYPGCKDRSLANKLASRSLVVRSVPLKAATLVVDRRFWNVKPVEVIAWTDSVRNFNKLPMRVQSVDLGELEDGKVVLQCMQDVFGFSQGIFGDPILSGWERPTQDIAAIPAAEQVVIEAPYAIVRRDPDFPLVLDRLWCAARDAAGGGVTFKIYQRNDPVTPSGAYAEAGEVFGFLLIGELRTALTGSGSGPGAETLELDPNPDAVLEMFEAFTQSPSAGDVGQNLVNLVFCEGEWMAFRTVTNQGTHVALSNGYRGMLDSTPAVHAVDAKVFLAFIAGGLSRSTIPQPNVVDVQLRPTGLRDEVDEAEATTVQLAMDDVPRRAIVPCEPTFNGVRYDDPVDIDDLRPGGSGLDASGVDVIFRRRDYRVLDEVLSLLNDAAALSADFPSADSHENRTRITELDETLSTTISAFWKLDEASSTTRLDATAANVDLTDNGGVAQLASAKIGAGAALDGVNDFLEAASSSELSFGDEDFSFAGWFRLTTKTTGVILSKSTVQGNQQSYALFYDGTVDLLRWAVSSDGSTATDMQATRFGSPNAGEWIHFYVEHDATRNRIRARFNFGQYTEAAHSGGAFASTAKFRLGANKDSGGADANFFPGDLDAIGCWNRLLSEAEQGLLFFGTVGQEHPFAGRRNAFLMDWSVHLNAFASRTEWLENLGGSLPATTYRTLILARHTFEAQVFQSRNTLAHDFDLDASDLDSLDSLGIVRANHVSPSYTVDSTATWNFEIGTALDGDVQARLNGGAFATVIAAGNLTGTLAVTSGDVLEVRHQTEDAPDRTLLLIKDATPTNKAYAVLVRQTTAVLESLAAHWKMNEGGAGSAVDAHTNGLDLSQFVTSIGTFADGKIGSARGTYSSGAYHGRTVASNDKFDIIGAVSVSFFCWIRFPSALGTDPGVSSIWGTLTADKGFFFRVLSGTPDLFQFAMGDGAGGSINVFADIDPIPIGEWIAVGFSYEHVGNTMAVYAKKDAAASVFNIAAGPSGGFQHSNLGTFQVGGSNHSVANLGGYIDSMSWWKGRALQKPQFDWLAEGHDLEDFDQIP